MAIINRADFEEGELEGVKSITVRLGDMLVFLYGLGGKRIERLDGKSCQYSLITTDRFVEFIAELTDISGMDFHRVKRDSPAHPTIERWEASSPTL